MLTCFLFAAHFDEDSCLSLRLDEQGHVNEPLMRRTVDELRVLQSNARTVVVLPTVRSSLYELELPWLPEQKARAALPFALEEQLAQPVTLLHVAFDRHHYQHGRYLVVAIEKNIVIRLMERLTRLQITFDVITLDWFALNLGESCVIDQTMLIDDATFKGALSLDLSDRYLKTQTTYSSVFIFHDSPVLRHAERFTPRDTLSYHWIAARLLTQKPMNLCQGELQHNLNQHQTKRWYQLAAVFGGMWLIGVLMMNAIVLGRLNHHVADSDHQIAMIYRQFFPEAHHVISPKFRIGQLLKQNQSGQNALLWQLLEKLSYAVFPNHSASGQLQGQSSIIQRIHFQNKTLSVTLACQDFAALEHIEARLQHEHVTVHQTGASTQANRVVATLELL